MTRRCANPECVFDFMSMHGVCSDPHSMGTLEDCTRGSYYGLLPSGDAILLETHPSPHATGNLAWLCCACAAEYKLVSKIGDEVILQAAPDPHDFVRRWEFEALASLPAHEA
jgi:hypothetical protein